jgi:hypothetical protein
MPDYDKCQTCKGAKGGVPGNENIIDGLIMCDYCDAALPTPEPGDGKEE